MFAFCRPGGNTQGGESSPRAPLIVQEVWFTGWKKFHGMKWQTITLANGMDFHHVWGPLSVKWPDAVSLVRSNIYELMRQKLRAVGIPFKIFGDSAFWPNDYMSTMDDIPGRGLSSVRETVEWSYKDVKMLWKYCDYKHVLQMRKQPVAKIMFVCMLMRNAYVTMNACQTAEFLDMMPPSLEDWLSQGPCAHPLPSNCVWSEDYEIPDYISDDEDSENEEDNFVN